MPKKVTSAKVTKERSPSKIKKSSSNSKTSMAKKSNRRKSKTSKGSFIVKSSKSVIKNNNKSNTKVSNKSKKGPKSKSNSNTNPKPSVSIQTLFQELCADTECTSMLKKFLTKELFEKLLNKKTKMGSGLMDVIQSGLLNHDSGIGVYAPDPEAYHVFADLFNPIIEEYHGFDSSCKQPEKHFGDTTMFIDLDPSKKFIVSTRVRVGRSVKGYPFNPCMKESHYKELEQKISQLLQNCTDEELKGQYYPLQGMSKEQQQKLIDEHFLFKEGDKFLIAANACRYWPVGRGIFLNKNKTFMVWIGEEDHIRIISMEDGANLQAIYHRLIKGVKYIESHLECSRDSRLGYLTFCPTNLGTTLRASVMIKLPNLAANQEMFQAKADELCLQIRGGKGEHTDSPDGLYDVSNKRRLGLTEFQAVMEMQYGVLKLIEMEKSMGPGTDANPGKPATKQASGKPLKKASKAVQK